MGKWSACSICKGPATKVVIWADGRGGQSSCEDHLKKVKDRLSDVVAVRRVEDMRSGSKKTAMMRIAADNWKDKLSGGLADSKDPDDFDAMELSRGVRVELEHTSDRSMATEIAMDHLVEDPEYYQKLEAVEKNTPH